MQHSNEAFGQKQQKQQSNQELRDGLTSKIMCGNFFDEQSRLAKDRGRWTLLEDLFLDQD